MKNNIIIAGLSLFALLYLIYMSNHYTNDSSTDLKVKALESQVSTLKQKAHNDSILLKEYQDAFSIFLETNPKAAMKFSKIMEDINTK